MASTPATDPRPGNGESAEVSGPVFCSHCGLPVSRSMVERGEPLQFCCNGCRAAYHVLKGAGLDEYYRFRERLGESGQPVDSAAHREFSEFDTSAFAELYCRVDEEGNGQTEFMLEGVHCAACVWLVERLPRLEPSVHSARLNMARRVVEIQWKTAEAGGVPLSQVASSLAQLGYRPRPARGQAAEQLHRDDLRKLMIRMGVAGASAGNVMLMAFALYSGAGDASSMHETGTMSEGMRHFFEFSSLLVSLPALWAGSLFFRGALSSLRTRVPHMDLPIAIGILVGFAWGTHGVITGAGEIYFDSITALIFFLLVGRYLQTRHQMRASEAAELLHAVTPADARRLVSPVDAAQPLARRDTEVVAAESINLGDVVVVESGEIVPIDGQVAQGASSLDRSLLSGESRPVAIGVGASVEAGSLNVGARLFVEAERTGAETRVARLMLDVERAMSTRAPLVALADRLAGGFTLTVLGLALAVGAFFWSEGPDLAIDRALSLLIVACPCALGLATPLALSASVSQAARSGKLIFGAETLETLAAPATVVLDKTGTLTEGNLSVVESWGSPSADSAILAAESGAHHPVARALRDYLEARLDVPEETVAKVPAAVSEVREHLGRGITATLGEKPFLVGSRAFIEAHAAVPDGLRAVLVETPPERSAVLVALGGTVVSCFWLGDRLRDDARAALVRLRAAGHRLVLLSGDHADTVAAVAAELAGEDAGFWVDVVGEVTPEEKLRYVENLRALEQRVFMVGDGVNDAGALAVANAGVAVSGAAEASQLSADVFLSRPGVSELAALLDGAVRTLRTIRRGIAFSLIYNVIGVSLAALGFLGPLGAAVLMPISSITVVTNAYRSRMFAQPAPGSSKS